MRDTANSQLILDWYDQHARKLPWRVSPADRAAGIEPDPYKVWLSEIMLQQTTVAAVKDYFLKFTQLWPRVQDLAAAEDADVMAEWAGLGYYARARNLLKCARMITNQMNSCFPDQAQDLMKLPGIGPYTSAAIAAIAFDRPETVLDGNVERVMARLFSVETPLPTAKSALFDLAESLTPEKRPGDYAQAVMDLGATICTPKSPTCALCPWSSPCTARAEGRAAELPKKLPKTPKPVRYGHAYIAVRTDGAVLLQERPAKGLLGGMLGWPGSQWSDKPDLCPPLEADWCTLPAEVRHTFTHFHLRLTVHIARVDMAARSDLGAFIPRAAFRPSALPTVMRKVWDIAQNEIEY